MWLWKFKCAESLTFAIIAIIMMQNTITSLGAHYNKLALQLAQKEYAENLRSIEEEGQLTHTTIQIGSRIYGKNPDDPEELRKAHAHYSPSDLSLKLAAITLDIYTLFTSRNKLPPSQTLQIEDTPPKTEAPPVKQSFPWSIVWDLNPRDRSDKAKIKKLLVDFHKSHPLEVKRVSLKFSIGQNELNLWTRTNERVKKELAIKTEVQERSQSECLTLPEFKKLAKRTLRSRHFRPSDTWCLSFIKKHSLEERIDPPNL